MWYILWWILFGEIFDMVGVVFDFDKKLLEIKDNVVIFEYLFEFNLLIDDMEM